jgi:hypothetical protein
MKSGNDVKRREKARTGVRAPSTADRIPAVSEVTSASLATVRYPALFRDSERW